MLSSVLRCAVRLRPSLTSTASVRSSRYSAQTLVPNCCCRPATMCTTAGKPADSKDREVSDSEFHSSTGKHKLTDALLSPYEKRKLVWTGFYKSMNDVPDRVPDSKLERAGSLWRIYTNVASAVMLLTILLITIKLGQRHRRKQLLEAAGERQELVSGHAKK